jgi:hypothetical protein
MDMKRMAMILVAMVGCYVPDGTEAETVAPAPGPRGADGSDGRNGVNGENGRDGAQGPTGAKGYTGESYVIQHDVDVFPGSTDTGHVLSFCDPGDRLLSGGCKAMTENDLPAGPIYSSHPETTPARCGSGIDWCWHCSAYPGQEKYELVAYALCLDETP